MSELIRDFTPLFSKDKLIEQQVNIQDDIAHLLTFLNTYQLIEDGGIDLYLDKKGYETIPLKDTLGYDILDYKELSHFLATTISKMGDEAYHKGDVVVDISNALSEMDPNDKDSCKKLEKIWQENSELLQDLLFLYSEYLYKVFLDNPYRPKLKGLKRD